MNRRRTALIICRCWGASGLRVGCCTESLWSVLDVEGVDYEHFDFTLDKGVEVTVKWEWAVDGDEVINWYLLKEKEFKQWEDSEDFSYVVNAKNSNDDSGEVGLEDGDYVFLFNNAENDDTVSLSFEATIEWEVEVVIKSSRNLVNEWFPYVLACEVLSFLSLLGSTFLMRGEVPEESPISQESRLPEDNAAGQETDEEWPGDSYVMQREPSPAEPS